MKKENKFVKPLADIVEFRADDVILTSIIGQIGEGDVPEDGEGGE